MKKVVVMLGAYALIGLACAQSKWDLFGVIDLNLRKVENGNLSAVSMGQGTVNASRLGFRGEEDLGGGLKTAFWLEHGFNPDTGSALSATQFWNRRSTLSLLSNLGEVRLGHDNTPGYWNLIVFDPFGGGGVGSVINALNAGAFSTPLNSGATTISRSDNGVGYFLPSGLGGVYGHLQLTAAEGVAGAKHTGARLGYAAGPINIAASYGNTKIANSKDFDIYSIGAAWSFNRLKLIAQYIDMKTGMVSRYRADGGQHTALVGATVQVGAGQIKAAYTEGRGNGYYDTLRTKQLALGYVHNLSRRTALYTYAARVQNKGGSGYIVGPVPRVTAASVDPAGTVTTSSMAPQDASGHYVPKTSRGIEFGIRHSF
ncbi:porin [Verminephrobacter aporrectodeae subsp. tuberculatae]|uniref:porin n=1 Tax=Verminephrobacter aporrectodeae TaxID=1110389 RepID=UPI002238EB2B|nr:porin [Verminephrobacter aporrectodeae]MCW5256713.1 porin [Verminephrobacter aporrectodeae subsp. tuberculatae]